MPRDRGARRGAILAAYLVAALVFAGHLALGANSTLLALICAAAWFTLLAGLIATQVWARRAIDAAQLWPIAAPFAVVVALAVLALTPVGVSGPHPIWNYVPGSIPVVAIDPYANRIEIMKLLALAASFLTGMAFGADDERAKQLLRATLLVGSAFGLWAFVEHVSGRALLYGGQRPVSATRLLASFGSANTAATLFGALTLLGLTDLMRSFDRAAPSRRFHVSHLQRIAPRLARPLVTLLIMVTCLILTQSRAGVAITGGASVALLGAMTLARARSRSIAVPVFGAGAMVIGLAASSIALNFDALQQRFTVFGNDALIRSQVFSAHWAAIQDAPWSGYGLGGFARVNGMIMNATNVSALETIGAVHNVYIQWLEQGGVLGAAAMFLTVAIIGVRLLGGIFRRASLRTWLMAIAAVLLLFLLHGATDYALEVPSMALFLNLLLGVGVGASPALRIGRRPRPATRVGGKETLGAA